MFVFIFVMHIFIVQRIDLEVRSMRYIKIDIIINYYRQSVVSLTINSYTA